MYRLERISLHDWYLMEGRDIEVSGSTALVGPTGAGKSALMDGMQTVLSGNNRNIIRLNSAAGEARDRRVVDYCLGCVSDVDDGKPGRSRAESVLALTFRHAVSGHQVAIGVMLTADEDEPGGERTAQRFVIQGEGFRLADFIEVTTEGKRFMPGHEVLVQRMRERFAGRKGKLGFFPSAQSYVQEYLTAMRPRNAPDPRRFLSVFSNALAAREIQDPTDFVRRFVLDPNPLNIRRVRESIETWRSLQDEVNRLEEMLRAARALRARFVGWVRAKAEYAATEFTAILCERLRLEYEIAELEGRKGAFEARERDLSSRIKELDDQAQRLIDQNQQDMMLAAQSGTEAKRLALEAQIKATREARDAAQAQLQGMLAPYLRTLHLDRIRSHLPTSTHDGTAAAAELASLVHGRRPVEWADQWATVSRLTMRVSHLAKAQENLQRQQAAVLEELGTARREAEELDARIKGAGDSGVMLDRRTIEFRQELRRKDIDAVAVPDIVEVADPRWAFALEALLGPYREALIVPHDTIDEAFALLYRNRHQFDGCRLINTRKTRGARQKLNPGSIAEMAQTDDPDARAFIETHVGRYIMVDTESELVRSDRGIMPNGKTSEGMGMRVFRDRTPILGRTAQVAALDAARCKREELATKITALQHKAEQLGSGRVLLEALATAEPPSAIEEAGRKFDDAVQRVRGFERDREDVDAEAANDLARAIEERTTLVREIREERNGLDGQVRQAIGSIERIRSSINDKTQRCSHLTVRENDLEAAQRDPRERRAIQLAEAELLEILRERVCNKLGLNWHGREVASLRAEEEDARRRTPDEKRAFEEAGRRAEGALRTYITDVERNNPLAEEADHFEKLFWINGRVERSEKHELMPYKSQVDEARGEVERMLKEDLLARLDERLQGVRRQLDTLNRRLAASGHTFLGQTYAFRPRPNEKLRPLADLARYMTDNPQLGFEAMEKSDLPPNLKSALEHVEQIVGSNADVAEIEDYRRYFEFEIEMRVGDAKPVSFSSVIGKLSGGQRQAPYYVAIAASLVSVYFPGHRAGDAEGMSLLLFDEAFSKLDVKTTRALLDLFRSLGLQVFVAAPEDKRATLLENVDTIVSIAREDRTRSIFIASSSAGPRAREAMAAANPENLGVEGFRRLLADAPEAAAAAS